uniref:Integrase catalytic domain-containing protein n=1 Tax=Trichogramma kaykai TaxID=54128 RepID=A0ABD2WGL6_9HYME
MTTKAIHLKTVGDLSTKSLFGALTRFTGRRGLPTEICIDNATHFHRADLELREALNSGSIQWTQISDRLEANGTSWRFIPPRAPHFGGLWEAAVRSFKTHLKRTLGPRRLIYEEFCTVLIGIEAVLISRPLGPVTGDPDDLTVLTLGHFLVGGPLMTVPQPEPATDRLDSLTHWALARSLQAVFYRK